MKKSILVVEDDKTIASGLEYSLQNDGYNVTICYSQGETLAALAQGQFQLAIVDITLPDGNGYDVCREIKKTGDVPVIFLTACDDEVNVVMGLDMGADDYITKPFRIRELLSRIKTVLRRYGKPAEGQGVFQSGNIKVNLLQGKVYKRDKEVLLTALEYRLFLTLINHEGQALSRNQLLEGIWDIAGDFVNDNTLTVYIKRLREKIEEDPQNPEIIKTIRGVGYKVGD